MNSPPSLPLPVSVSWIMRPFNPNQLPSMADSSCATVDQEKMKRWKTCRFMEEAGNRMGLPRLTVSTACVFFQRFYTKKSFGDFDRFESGICCLFLATKVEETPRKLAYVVETCYDLKMQSAKKTVVVDKEGRALKDSSRGGGGGALSGLESSSSEKKTAELNVLKEKVSVLILEAPPSSSSFSFSYVALLHVVAHASFH